jgi:hypothetical protein
MFHIYCNINDRNSDTPLIKESVYIYHMRIYNPDLTNNLSYHTPQEHILSVYYHHHHHEAHPR